MSHFIVQSASASMPRSVKAPYKRVAVLEVPDDVVRASMISERAKDVIRVVQTWEKCNVGQGIRSAYSRALSEAIQLCGTLNLGKIEQEKHK